MTSRQWTNNGGIALSAANLNSLEADLDTALGVPDAALANRVKAGATKTALDATYSVKPDNGGKPVGKGELVSYAKDFGLVGDGSNEFAKLKTFLETGGTLIFEKGKTYSYTPATVIQIPVGTTIITNNSKLYELSSADGFWLRINDNTYIDNLDISIAGGVPCRGLWIGGNNVHIENLKVVSRGTINSGTTNRRVAVTVGLLTGDTNTPHTNIRLDSVRIENWECAMTLISCDGITIGNLELVGAKQGVYVKDCLNWKILGGYSKTLSPFALGNPGENSIIMESTVGNDTCADGYVANFKSYVSGEHGFRLGGQYTMKNITFENCYASAAGSGLGTQVEPDNHGGCGFKILGATTVLDANATHDNIKFLNCTVESLYDSRRSGRDDGNFVGFQIGKASNVHLQNPTVRGKRNPTTYVRDAYAAWDGIRVIGSINVSINNPHISNCANAGIIFYDQDPTSYNWGGGCTAVNVIGGIVKNTPYGVAFQMRNGELARSVKIDGTYFEGTTNDIWVDPATPATSLNLCFARFSTKGCTTLNVVNATELFLEMFGNEVGNNQPKQGSSIFRSDGFRKTVWGGAWLYVNARGNTASRPTTVAIGQSYYDMSLNKPIWVKSLGPTVWVDATGTAV